MLVCGWWEWRKEGTKRKRLVQERVGDRNEENGKRREKSGVVGDQRLREEEEKRKGAWATNHRLECVQKVGDVIEVSVRDHNRE